MNEEIFDKVEKKMNNEYVHVSSKTSEIIIKIQDGPIREVGENGAQIDVLGEVWLEIIKGFNAVFPCRENSITITKIEEALLWQMKRTMNREKRGVEGFNKE